MGGLSLGLHLLRCPAAVGHPDPPTAEGLCVEQRRGGRLPDLVLLGGVLLCVRHVLCDPGRAVTVARPGTGAETAVRAFTLRTAVLSEIARSSDAPWAILHSTGRVPSEVRPTLIQLDLVHGLIALLGNRDLGHTKCPQSLTRCGG